MHNFFQGKKIYQKFKRKQKMRKKKKSKRISLKKLVKPKFYKNKFQPIQYLNLTQVLH